MPTVSVGIPVYNGEKFLKIAAEAVLSQTFADFELILCDNASNDSTGKICLEYAAKDSRVRYFRNPQNIGAAANFRRVFNLSSGKYFKWVGVDDFCGPEYLEKCVKVLEGNPAVILCCTKVNIIDDQGTIPRQYQDLQELLQTRPVERFAQYFRQDSKCNVIYGLIRSEVLKKTPCMGDFSGSDIVLVAELSLHGQFYEIPEYLFFRRIHPEAFSYECSLEKQQEFYRPGKTKDPGIVLRSWRNIFEHCKSAFRAPLYPMERLRLLFHILKMARWQRKILVEEIGLAMKRIF